MQIKLIDEERASIEEIVNTLLGQKNGSVWAKKTNQDAINYAKHLGEVYGDNWYKGFLPKEFLFDILLPEHGHEKREEDGTVFFPLDTPPVSALELLKNLSGEQTRECRELVNYLKQEIKKDGFTSSIVLAVINDTLKHVDGLHRILALASLLQEEYEYKPVPVFLCDRRE
ncbi:MAG TPA: hypothetical protein VGO63_02430 [Candidatus Paceibacterota bacterium]|jgi:hypothetical protein|nr:hypothetical protein [Candidatus Paceibacterota bacterium]